MSHVLHLGDSLLGMAGLPDKSVDHTICDPPFASEIYERCKKNPGRNSGDGRGHRKGIQKYSVGLKAMTEGAIGTMDAVLEVAARQIARVTRRWAIVFCDVESLHLWKAALVDAGMQHVRTGAWTKADPMPQFSGDRPAQGFEVCEIAYGGGRPRWNGGGMPALWHYPISKGSERPDHPCPKPLDLMERLIADFTDAGELVMDPFAGSATTAVACKRLGRRFVGWELNEAWHAAAVRRIDAAREQFQLPRMSRPKQLPLSGPDSSNVVAKEEPAA